MIVAEFSHPAALLKAASQVREAGYSKFDCHSPFPIHGMDVAMGLKRSPLGWIIGAMAFIGGSGALTLQWWTSTIDYPLVIAGKPFFSFQAYVPITFGLAVLFGAFGALLGMLILNRLPRLHHPIFYSGSFAKVTTDGFFLSIESVDSKFDANRTVDFLKLIGGTNVQLLQRNDSEGL